MYLFRLTRTRHGRGRGAQSRQTITTAFCLVERHFSPFFSFIFFFFLGFGFIFCTQRIETQPSIYIVLVFTYTAKATPNYWSAINKAPTKCNELTLVSINRLTGV